MSNTDKASRTAADAERLRALKDAVDQGLEDLKAGRVSEWDFEDLLRRARSRKGERCDQVGGHAPASSLSGRIHNGRHHLPVRVYYEDTDFSGVVYHASYLRFMERGRTEHLRALGADQRALFEEAQKEAPGFAFVVRAMQIEFLRPARMDDLLTVVTTPQEVRGASITLHQRVMRGEETLVEASVRVAFISGGSAQRIPKSLRDLLQGHHQA